jgi:hypothetical protein
MAAESFLSLPNEVLVHIAKYLEPKDWENFALTCKRLNQCARIACQTNEFIEQNEDEDEEMRYYERLHGRYTLFKEVTMGSFRSKISTRTVVYQILDQKRHGWKQDNFGGNKFKRVKYYQHGRESPLLFEEYEWCHGSVSFQRILDKTVGFSFDMKTEEIENEWQANDRGSVFRILKAFGFTEGKVWVKMLPGYEMTREEVYLYQNKKLAVVLTLMKSRNLYVVIHQGPWNDKLMNGHQGPGNFQYGGTGEQNELKFFRMSNDQVLGTFSYELDIPRTVLSQPLTIENFMANWRASRMNLIREIVQEAGFLITLDDGSGVGFATVRLPMG